MTTLFTGSPRVPKAMAPLKTIIDIDLKKCMKYLLENIALMRDY